MINDGCPTNDNTVSLHVSGDNNKARWEAQMFRFVEESEVWLHCDIKACDSRKYNCETICPNDGADDAGRRRRDDWDVIVKDRSRRGVTAAKAQDTAEYKV